MEIQKDKHIADLCELAIQECEQSLYQEQGACFWCYVPNLKLKTDPECPRSLHKRHLITEKSAFFLTDAVAKQEEIVSL